MRMAAVFLVFLLLPEQGQASLARIGTRSVRGVRTKEFCDTGSGLPFVPRGNNYIRLANQPDPFNPSNLVLYHSTFDPGLYDHAAAETAFAAMQQEGYNIVRVFINDYRVGKQNGGTGLDTNYLANVADYISLADSYGVYVMLTFPFIPKTGQYYSPVVIPNIEDINNLYMNQGFINAKEQYLRDFIVALQTLGTPMNAIFSYNIENEMYYIKTAKPVSMTNGLVTTADGVTYNMAAPSDRQKMMDSNMVNWINQVRNAILQVQPNALVGVGFFSPEAVANPSDPRITRTYWAIADAATGGSTADFIDLHAYPGTANLTAEMAAFEIPAHEKPLILGEFGAFKNFYATSADAAQAMSIFQADSVNDCGGFAGWLLWTWNTDESPEIYNTLSGNGEIGALLSPLVRPNPGSPQKDSITLANPSFEQGYNATYPGYLTTIPGWTIYPAPLPGINDVTGPFWDNGGPVDRAHVGFMQWDGIFQQTLSGFQVGETYWIQFYANARSALAESDTPDVTVVETASTLGGSPLVSGVNITPVDEYGTAGNGTPFTLVTVPFTAVTTSGNLRIQKTSHSGSDSGNACLLVDGFSVIRRTPNDVIIGNPSFEASGTNAAYPGTVSRVAGWTGVGELEINQQNGPFADNGAVPDGDNVLVIHRTGGVSQTLHGLVPGEKYQLSLYLNARSQGGDSGSSDPTAVVQVGGNLVYSNVVSPVGGQNFYQRVSRSFTAGTANSTLIISNSTPASTDSALLVDNVRVISFAVAAPTINSGTMLANGSFQVNFSGSAGQPFRVLSADSLIIPAATWSVLNNGNFGPGGFGSFTDSNVAGVGKQRFYRIVSP